MSVIDPNNALTMTYLEDKLAMTLTLNSTLLCLKDVTHEHRTSNAIDLLQFMTKLIHRLFHAYVIDFRVFYPQVSAITFTASRYRA